MESSSRDEDHSVVTELIRKEKRVFSDASIASSRRRARDGQSVTRKEFKESDIDLPSFLRSSSKSSLYSGSTHTTPSHFENSFSSLTTFHTAAQQSNASHRSHLPSGRAAASPRTPFSPASTTSRSSMQKKKTKARQTPQTRNLTPHNASRFAESLRARPPLTPDEIPTKIHPTFASSLDESMSSLGSSRRSGTSSRYHDLHFSPEKTHEHRLHGSIPSLDVTVTYDSDEDSISLGLGESMRDDSWRSDSGRGRYAEQYDVLPDRYTAEHQRHLFPMTPRSKEMYTTRGYTPRTYSKNHVVPAYSMERRAKEGSLEEVLSMYGKNKKTREPVKESEEEETPVEPQTPQVRKSRFAAIKQGLTVLTTKKSKSKEEEEEEPSSQPIQAAQMEALRQALAAERLDAVAWRKEASKNDKSEKPDAHRSRKGILNIRQTLRDKAAVKSQFQHHLLVIDEGSRDFSVVSSD